MRTLLVGVDRSRIRPGKAKAVEAAFRELVAFVDVAEPRVISYAVHMHPDGAHVTVVQVHRDSASMERHMELAAAKFAAFRDLLEIVSVDLYGDVSPTLFARMEQKAAMLGHAAVAVHPRAAGFDRATPQQSRP